MRKRKTERKLKRPRAQRKALLAGIASEVVRHGRVKTTAAKAKEARKTVERAITVAKQGTIASRRNLERMFPSEVAQKLTQEIAPRYQDRSGGYTRVIPLTPRRGDRAPLAYLELIEE